MNKIFLTIYKNYFFLSILIVLGCSRADLEKQSPKKAIFVYIAANNDLKYSALKSLDLMELGYKQDYGDLIVYIKTERRNSYILKIKNDNKIGTIVSDTLKVYDSRNSSSFSFMEEVFKDMKSFTTAEEYGVILWSHATSWLPEFYNSKKIASFGYDRGVEMDFKDLKKIIPKKTKFILFDACYMSSIESVYELRNSADYIIASSSEVLSSSHPYDIILGDLFSENYKIVCQKFLEFYNKKIDIEQSATISLINTSHLGDLAFQTKNIFKKYDKKGVNITSSFSQDFNFEKKVNIGFYDFLSIIRNNCKDSELSFFEEEFNKCVVYSANTKKFFNIPIIESSGLTLSLIDKNLDIFEYYKSLDWYLDSGLNYIN